MQHDAVQNAPSQLLCYYYATKHCCCPKCEVNFPWQDFSNTSLTFDQYPDISLTDVKLLQITWCFQVFQTNVTRTPYITCSIFRRLHQIIYKQGSFINGVLSAALAADCGAFWWTRSTVSTGLYLLSTVPAGHQPPIMLYLHAKFQLQNCSTSRYIIWRKRNITK